MIRMQIGVRALALVGAVSLAACGSTPGEKIRPTDPTFANARGGAGDAAACHEVQAESTPLVVDWNPEERGDLEASMKQGIAVVHYDCKSVKLLPDCHPEGTYSFLGITKKEQVISIENADQAQANLPLHGASIGASMERGSTIDVGLFMIGKKTTRIDGIEKTTLPAHCEGATHYVQSALVGAFAMHTSTSGAAHAKAAIDVFGASADSKSNKGVTNKDGEVDACKGADVDATNAPNGCGAPVRIRLLAVGEAKAETDEKKELVCPKGLVVVDGKCSTKPADKAFECDFTNDPTAVCVQQCAKGSRESCANAAAHYIYGHDATQKDEAKANQYINKACQLEDWGSCNHLAGNMNGSTEEVKKGRALFLKGCDAGNADSCTGLGSFLSKGEDQDWKKGVRAYMRGCDGGDAYGCTFAAEKLATGGSGLTADLPRAIAIDSAVCDLPLGTGGRGQGCYDAANWIAKKDPVKAKKYMKRACEDEYKDFVNDTTACKALKKMK